MPDIFISPKTINTSNNNSDANSSTIIGMGNGSNKYTNNTIDTVVDSTANTGIKNHENNSGSKKNTGIKVDAKVPGILSTLIHHPQKLTFSQQDEDEEIIIFVRRHFVTNVPWIITVLVAAFAPLFIIPIVSTLDFSLFAISLGMSIVLLFFYYLLVFGFALYSYADWYYNIGISTNKRLLDLDFTHLSYIDLAIAMVPEVEHVVYRQQGFFASYFNYGDVIAHTITGKEDFVFEKVPKPDVVVDTISNYIGGPGH